MELVKPAFGLIFWMCISFGLILFILKKFAWSPILKMLNDRETSIQEALDSEERAKEEMKSLQAGNEKILAEARHDRDQMLKDARDIREKMIAEAKTDAAKANEKMIKEARESIKNEKMAAITELKNQVGMLSLEIAEKVLKAELASDEKQKALVNTLLKEVNLN